MSQYEYMVKITVNSEEDLLAEKEHTTVNDALSAAFDTEDGEEGEAEIVKVEVVEARKVPQGSEYVKPEASARPFVNPQAKPSTAREPRQAPVSPPPPSPAASNQPQTSSSSPSR